MTASWVPDESADDDVRALRARADALRAARSTADLLYWDDRVTRPRDAAAWRATQRAVQAGIVHDLVVSDDLHAAIARVEDRHGTDHVEARAMRRERDRVLQVPREVYARREAVASAARAAWDEARRLDDFAVFLPQLEAMVETMRAYADGVGYEGERYAACVDEWEPGIDLATIDRCFGELHDQLRPRLDRRRRGTKSVTLRELEPAAMHEFERRVLDLVGFEHDAGLLVQSDRAFCIALGPRDVRMTSRFHVTPCFRGIHSTIHEAGHAVYAQALGRLGVPSTLAVAPGLGMDEAQSRMFENMVGRSRAFTRWAFRQLRELAPAAYPSDEDYDAFHAEVTTADSPLRRLGTDELTYNLHILVRTTIERQLVNGDLAPRDLPEAWRAQMHEVLDVEPDGDVDGCLQDVHWSLGQWGYFPTYTLGNMYATQLLEQAELDLGEPLALAVEAGSTAHLRAWLDANVYVHGRAYTGVELVERVTGRPLDVAPLVAHLDRAFPPVS